MKAISLLIIEDSPLFSKLIQQALISESYIQIKGVAANGKKAQELIKMHQPDFVTLDMELPDISGLDLIAHIQELSPKTRIIMVSAHTRKGADLTLNALAAGAHDFITKPDRKDKIENIESLSRQLKTKINVLNSCRSTTPAGLPPKPTRSTAHHPITQHHAFQAIVIGVSTGGPKALSELIPSLVQKTHLPILIVQHMPGHFTKSLAEQLQKKCPGKEVLECSKETPIKPNHCYIAAGGKHLTIRNGTGGLVAAPTDGPVENGCKPAVDVLFRSAAVQYKDHCLALILTGMGSDGTKGAGAIKRHGGYVIVQDEPTSVVWGMPGRAVAANVVDEVLPLQQMPQRIAQLIQQKD